MNTETVPFQRHETRMEHGRRVAGEPTELGALHVLAAPGTYERQTDTGRLVVTSGYDLYLRGTPPFDVRVGDTAVVRGETLTVTRTPEDWRRGDRRIGVQYHVERSLDS
ncbi:hypothetical protein [Bifidobacterium vansinderenii]|uniref:Uncharacterized protein n=1 Tax=Bifidobacterium vansinderenii TaxID=1984871 RepID=A0A229W1B5_9BIFI|nr:hypothetical protein [Bifidobacterium vansinderenii]OXN01654.1 hypothetical protein Tam10B_0096 [Bifidobacterium vansinderenii]